MRPIEAYEMDDKPDVRRRWYRRHGHECWHVFILTAPTFLFWVLVLVFVLMPFMVRAQDSRTHHLYHHFYEGWKTKEGHSCCNHNDCRPASVRQNGEKVEAFIEGEWVTAPPDTVRPYTTPDMQSHVCNQGKRIICVSVGGGI